MKIKDVYNAVYAIAVAQGWSMEDRPSNDILSIEDRLYIIKSPVKEPKITLEDTIDQSFQRLKVRSNIKLVDKTK